LRGFDYAATGAYLVTVCVLGRRCVLGNVVGDRTLVSPLGRVVTEALLDVPSHWNEAVSLDCFVVMPNHVHAILCIGRRAGQAPPLPQVVGGFKAASSRHARSPVVAALVPRPHHPGTNANSRR